MKTNLRDEVFSKFIVQTCCNATCKESVELIEPLVGVPRDPRFCTDGEPYLMSAGHILVSRPTYYRRAYFLDAGATYYNDTQSWFVEKYQKLGMKFDHIWLWEARQLNPVDIYSKVPDDLLPRYTYYNRPIVCGKSNMDPLNLISSIAEKDDYVVLKLDIDATILEECIINKIVSNKAISSLIDALYFEHHVNVTMMQKHWGKDMEASLIDSLLLFRKLRDSGIRAHGWM